MTHTSTTSISVESFFEEFPSGLVVLLYDEAIASLYAAVSAITEGDIEGRFKATMVTAEIISQLRLALDSENGGEIAANLDAIYTCVITQLPMLNLRNDPMIAKRLIGLLQPLRESWMELDERIRHDVANAALIHPVPLLPALENQPLMAEAVR